MRDELTNNLVSVRQIQEWKYPSTSQFGRAHRGILRKLVCMLSRRSQGRIVRVQFKKLVQDSIREVTCGNAD